MTSLDKYQMVDGWQDGKKRHKKQKKRSKKKDRAVSSSDEVNLAVVAKGGIAALFSVHQAVNGSSHFLVRI